MVAYHDDVGPSPKVGGGVGRSRLGPLNPPLWALPGQTYIAPKIVNESEALAQDD